MRPKIVVHGRTAAKGYAEKGDDAWKNQGDMLHHSSGKGLEKGLVEGGLRIPLDGGGGTEVAKARVSGVFCCSVSRFF